MLGQGRLINLAAAEGHPSEVMDMSFANQFLGMLKLARKARRSRRRCTSCRRSRIRRSRATKLSTMGLAIDKLTAEQASYADDYSAGT